MDPIVGTLGNDTLFGTDGSDLIQGLAGNDTINPLGGLDDTVEGGDGDDVFIESTGRARTYGGDGIDTIDCSHGAITAININLLANSIYSDGFDGGGSIIVDVENIIGTVFDDAMIGSEVANLLVGGDGDDAIDAHDGDDTLLGGNGDDFLNGYAGDDVIDGGDGNDYISGGMGDDTIITGPGTGDVFGDGGFDKLVFEGVVEGIDVDLSYAINSNGFGGAGSFVSSIEAVEGSGFADAIAGDSRNNLLAGNDGADTISGGDGVDTVKGGGGDDVLDGGAGAQDKDIIRTGGGEDIVRFGAGWGKDIVKDFEDGGDLLDFSLNPDIEGPGDLRIVGKPNGSTLVRDLGDHGNIVVLQDVDASLIGVDDFIFA